MLATRIMLSEFVIWVAIVYYWSVTTNVSADPTAEWADFALSIRPRCNLFIETFWCNSLYCSEYIMKNRCCIKHFIEKAQPFDKYLKFCQDINGCMSPFGLNRIGGESYTRI